MFQKTTMAAAVAISTSMLLVACGGSNGDNNGAVVGASISTTGTLQGTPTTTVAPLTAAQFAGLLGSTTDGAQLLSLTTGGTNTLPCGIAISHIEYTTVGAANEATTASGAVMVPTGSDPACTGNRPVVLYAHGTTASKGFNMADLANPASKGEASLVAATFAAQGYIVIAPNYAGYDTSTLAYHPYVNYKQQSQEMIDALKAGRKALASSTVAVGSVDSGKLFVTGYSEGGYVAMAALKAMDAAHIPVTAGAPMSGPYSLGAYGDAIFSGNTPLGGTLFAPLLTTGYQKAYGNIYTASSDAYTAAYAPNVETLLDNPTFAASLLSTTNLPGLFQSAPTGSATLDAISPADPKFSFGFSATNYMVRTDYRGAYLADAQANPDGLLAGPTASNYPLTAVTPTNPLRKAFKLNDLRGYIPSMPVLMCGGNNDPTVFFAPNAQAMAGIMGNVAAAGAPVKFALLDVDATNPASAIGFSASPALGASVTGTMTVASQQLQTGFGQALQALAGTVPPAYRTSLVASKYHGGLVPPFCTIAARTFFQQY